MAICRKELEAMLVRLEQHVPQMIRDLWGDERIEAFVARASRIEANADGVDLDHVRNRIDAILGSSDFVSTKRVAENCP
jgi:hypothetical protein